MADFCRLGKMDQSRFGTTDLFLKRSGVCVAKFERIRLGNRRFDSNKYRTRFKRVLCCDASSDGNLVAAGTEFRDDGAFILYWYHLLWLHSRLYNIPKSLSGILANQ